MKRKPEKLSPRYEELFVAAYHDMVSGISSSEQERDLLTCKLRLEKEGLSFYTKTLPSLAKAVDIALATGLPLNTSSFKRRPGTKLPNLFGGLLAELFDDAGMVSPAEVSPGPRREAMTRSLRAIRQLGYLFYKLELPFEEDTINETLRGFKLTDAELPTNPSDLYRSDPVHNSVLDVAQSLIHRVLCNADPLSGSPRHGPGAVATGEKSPEKHVFKRYYSALAECFPYDEWFYYNASHVCEDLQGLQSLQELEAGTAKVVLVPKDSRGPRLISCEPLEYQWIQQSLLDVLVRHLEEKSRLTRGYVNFTDQGVNQRLALLGSETGDLCTLDMKDASDRVSLGLVKRLFPSNWVRALLAARSTKTRLPNGEIVTLRKFAPMGSAVCFPVEALTFWAISVASLVIRDLTLLNEQDPMHMRVEPSVLGKTTRFYYDARDKHVVQMTCTGFSVNLAHALPKYGIYVYGDDIVCNTADHGVVITALERYHLLVNRTKCCTEGFFRESCGVDAFHGVEVTPVRLRTRLDRHLTSPNNFLRLVGFANELWKRGLIQSALLVEKWIRSDYRYPLPQVSCETPSGVALVRPGLPPCPGRFGKSRFNKRLHRGEYLCMASHPLLKEGSDGYPRMLREQHRAGVIPSHPGSPLGHYPIAHRDRLKCAWTPYR